MAKKYNVDLEVVSSFTRNPGTKVKEGSNMEKLNVSGVARDNNCARVAIINLDDTPGTAFKVFSLMAKHHVNIDIILQSVGRDNKKSISFTIRQDDAERVEFILRDAKEMLGYEDLSINTKVAKVSIVGAGMASATGVASKMFEALAMAGINIRMISTSEIKISVLINEEDSEKAVKAIHEEFFNALWGQYHLHRRRLAEILCADFVAFPCNTQSIAAEPRRISTQNLLANRSPLNRVVMPISVFPDSLKVPEMAFRTFCNRKDVRNRRLTKETMGWWRFAAFQAHWRQKRKAGGKDDNR